MDPSNEEFECGLGLIQQLPTYNECEMILQIEKENEFSFEGTVFAIELKERQFVFQITTVQVQ